MAAKPSISLPFLIALAISSGALVGAAVSASGCGSSQRPESLSQSRTRTELAKDYLGKGQLEAAENEAQEAVRLAPSNEDAHYILGLVDLLHAHDAHRMSEIEDCLSGIDAEVQDGEAVARLEAAEVHFAAACEHAPDYGEAWYSRGVGATLLGRHEAAIEYFGQALDNSARLESAALAHAALGWAYFLRDDMVEATRELLRASRLQPGLCLATYRLGRVYFARKEWEKSLQKFQEVAEQSQCPIQDAHLYLMKAHVELGSSEALSEIGRSCVSIAPRSCVARQCRDLAPDLLGDPAGDPASEQWP